MIVLLSTESPFKKHTNSLLEPVVHARRVDANARMVSALVNVVASEEKTQDLVPAVVLAVEVVMQTH